MKAKVLLVCQEPEITKLIDDTLRNEGYEVFSSDVPSSAVSQCREETYDLVIVDVYIGEIPYDRLIVDIKKVSPETEIVVMTTYAFPETMVKSGTLDIGGYLIKPLTQDKIRKVTERALCQGQLARDNRRLLLAVTAAKKEWEDTVDATDDYIFVTDFDCNILRANLSTFRGLGKGVDEVIGHKCYEIFHCSDRPPDDCLGKRARNSGEPASKTIFFEGLKRRVNCSVYPQIFAVGGGLVHYSQESAVDVEQQVRVMLKYKKLFNDASTPMLFVSAADHKVIEVNKKAIKLFGYKPGEIHKMNLEDLFVASAREVVVENIINQIKLKEVQLKTKVLSKNENEIDVFIAANTIEIGDSNFVELFVFPIGLFRNLIKVE